MAGRSTSLPSSLLSMKLNEEVKHRSVRWGAEEESEAAPASSAATATTTAAAATAATAAAPDAAAAAEGQCAASMLLSASASSVASRHSADGDQLGELSVAPAAPSSGKRGAVLQEARREGRRPQSASVYEDDSVIVVLRPNPHLISSINSDVFGRTLGTTLGSTLGGSAMRQQER